MDNMVANDRAVDAMAQGVELAERADPSTPGANKVHVYAKDSGGNTRIYRMDSGGTAIPFDHTDIMARAYLTSTQAITQNTPEKLSLASESYDVGADFDAATNYRFTAPIAGYYSIFGSILYDAVNDGIQVKAYIYKNGAQNIRVIRSTGRTNDSPTVQIYSTLLLAASDYIELWADHNQAGDVNATSGEDATFLECHLHSI